MDEDERLRGAASWQFRPRQTDFRLGDEIAAYLEQHSRDFTKNASLLDIWDEVVPEYLLNQCRPGKRVGNTLYVEVAPGPFMHQMQTLSGEILERINTLAPRCGVRKLKMVPRLFKES